MSLFPSPSQSARTKTNGARIVAKSIYRELAQQGYDSTDMVAVVTELLDQVTTGLASTRPPKS